MIKNRILKILNIFAAIIISIILVAICVATPFYFSITALSKPKTIVKIIQNVDYKNIIKENKELKANLMQVGIDGEAADKLMKSPEAAVIIEDYSDEITDILVNIPTDKGFDISLVQQVIDDNIDNVLNLIEKNSKNPIVKEDLKTEINNAVKKYEKTIEKSYPVIKQVSVVVKTIHSSETIRNVLEPRFAALTFLTMIILIGIICFLRRTKAQYLLWIAVDFIISCIFLGVIIVFNNTAFVSDLALKTTNFGSQIILSTVSVLVNRLAISFLSFCFMALLLLTCYTVIYLKFLEKERLARTESTESIPDTTEESTVE